MNTISEVPTIAFILHYVDTTGKGREYIVLTEELPTPDMVEGWCRDGFKHDQTVEIDVMQGKFYLLPLDRELTP